MRYLKPLLILLLVAFIGVQAARIYMRKMYIWLPDYIRWQTTAAPRTTGPVHLFFLYVDHFEPGKRFDWTRRWVSDYPKLAARHRDSSGRPVQHTWFYPAEQPFEENLRILRELVDGGYGEVELHLHHGNDTQESTARKFREALAWFQKFDYLITEEGKTQFAFVHGNWSLDNGDGTPFCGANRELSLLRELGCYADFTFPSIWHDAQPPLINQIYMATDDDGPKSYARGVRAATGRPLEGDLMIFEGPLLLAATWDPARMFYRLEDGDVHPAVPLSAGRVDYWVKANVHVEGRPDWVFVKVHGHAASTAQDMEESLGAPFERALSHLEGRYNDGTQYILHYVTAREAYNLVRAAAAGKTGDPRQYYDWVLPPYRAHRLRTP